MKLTSALAGLAAAFAAVDSVAAAPQVQEFSVARFNMGELRARKEWARNEARSKGMFSPGKYKSKQFSKCSKGMVDNTYSCNNVDMHGFLSHEAMGSTTREGNDVWGWTSRSGREFGAVGQTDGTAFVEILRNGALRYVGRLPTQTVPSIWRDMKVIGDHVYIGSEAKDHGLQIFDMKKLLTVGKTPKVFSIETDLSAHFAGFGNSHNIAAHEETNMIYAVGTAFCGKGGLYFVDVTDPANPIDKGCAGEDGYVHDAQCVIYKGPDRAYGGKEICFGYNEDTLTVYDVTDKAAPIIISRTPYEGAAYTHQGWLANEAQTHLLLDDELDEMDNTAPGGNNATTTYIFDITSLKSPKNTGYYKSEAKSIDHNQYVIKGITYQSNYGSGLRMVDVSTVASHPDGSKFKEIGFFDCYPEDDTAQANEFYGSWSVYPYFRSGYILLNSIERGIFSLKYTGRRP